jgi:3-oxoadipate enol-lactonase
MQTTANGIDTHYTLIGPESAPVVMLSHSLATDLAMWRPQLEALSNHYLLLCYDTRGHGATAVPEGPYTLEQLADDAVGLLNALGIEKAHWVGISMGGMIGQALALNHADRLISLTLCDTTSQIPAAANPVWIERIETARAQGMEPLVAPTIERWFSPDYIDRRPDVIDGVRAMIRATPAAGFVGCAQAIMKLDYARRLAEIKLPTLIIVGEEDPGTPVADSELIHENISGSELIILPDARHLTNIEKADDFNRSVSAFLDRME